MLKIALTCGDPEGIGPEIIAKSLDSLLQYASINWILYLDSNTLASPYLDQYQLWQLLKVQKKYQNISIKLIHTKNHNSSAAHIAYESLKSACAAALNAEVSGIVTAPLSKEKIISAGFDFIDHTQFLAKASKTETRMAFHSSYFQVVLDSIHIPLREVSEKLNQAHLQKTLSECFAYCWDLGIEKPKIGIAGLNPHAGENGLFGTEEIEVIAPAIAWAQNKYPTACFQGPIPADTLFYKAYHKNFDLVLAMYHDQALAPLKMIAFDEAVNVTLGLPFVRTSPDHGTAFEIAHQNVAKPDSYLSACKLAAKLCIKKNV